MAVLIRKDGGQTVICMGRKAVVAFSFNLVRASSELKPKRSAATKKGAGELR
jgi:hypothetical protein